MKRYILEVRFGKMEKDNGGVVRHYVRDVDTEHGLFTPTRNRDDALTYKTEAQAKNAGSLLKEEYNKKVDFRVLEYETKYYVIMKVYKGIRLYARLNTWTQDRRRAASFDEGMVRDRIASDVGEYGESTTYQIELINWDLL